MNVCKSHKIVAIAGIGENRELGKNNGLCFHSKDDMAVFKAATEGHVVVMGRKTFESIRNAKGLPNRLNIVVTRDEELLKEGTRMMPDCQIMFESEVHSVLSILASQKEKGKMGWIIGGAEIYALFKSYTDAVLLSVYDGQTDPEADTFMPLVELDMKLEDSRVYPDFILEYYKKWS